MHFAWDSKNRGACNLSTISVIISTRNKANYLTLTLTGYALQTDRDFEIVLVNDGGSEETDQVVREYANRFTIRYLRLDRHHGAAAARNLALEAAGGNILLFADDDRIPCPTFIGEHRAALTGNGTVVSIGQQHRIVSHYTPELNFKYNDAIRFYSKFPDLLNSRDPRVLVTPDMLCADFQGTVESAYLSPFNDSLLHEMVALFGDELIGFHFGWTQAFTGNMAFNRREADDIRFDENYAGYGKEDTDYAYQLYRRGYRFRFTRHGENYHQEHIRKRGEMWEHIRNHRYFCDKFDTLEVLLHRLTHEGKLSLPEANAAIATLERYGTDMQPMLNNYLNSNRRPNEFS